MTRETTPWIGSVMVFIDTVRPVIFHQFLTVQLDSFGQGHNESETNPRVNLMLPDGVCDDPYPAPPYKIPLNPPFSKWETGKGT